MSRDNNSCPSHFSPTKASNPLPHKGFQVLRSQLVQNGRKIKSVRRFGRNYEKVEREYENETLGNVQGNNLSEQMEKLSRIIAGGGYIGKPLDKSTSFPVPSPLYHFKKKKKPSMDQGNPLTTLGFLDIFYCLWTIFIFPRRDLFAVDNSFLDENAPHSTVTLFARLRGLSTS
jgi:hypothetical protein